MHLFPNEAENSQAEDDITMSSVCGCIFCPMTRLSSSDYIHHWKQIPKTSEQQFVIGKLFTSKLDSIVKRLHSQHIMICVFKKTDTNVIKNFLFFSSFFIYQQQQRTTVLFWQSWRFFTAISSMGKLNTKVRTIAKRVSLRI